MKKEKYANFRSAKIVKLLKVEANEGKGTEEDPLRRVLYICTLDGKVLFSDDDTERLFAGTDEMKRL